ncbi:peptide chain release factor N(5)-glutamine methyltransferase [Clostridium sp.]|uniref:peptide chain release factor N(5)-glutamine methyltransferase n=1 Tax=Clostridium sp. TaxID=1506 RepID=UPI002FDE1417
MNKFYNVNTLLKQGYKILKDKKIESYILDVQLLLGKAINKDRLFIFINGDYKVTEEEVEKYYYYLKLREKKMPVKYILGQCEFMGMDFIVKPGVLIPRPDTETLVEQALEEIDNNECYNICDLCCGTGAIGISLAKFKEYINIVCCDISDTACEVAEQNVGRYRLDKRVKVVKSDLMEYFILNKIKFNMIVCNPPYIKESIIDTLMEDVKNYEPYEALNGGEDGLEFYRKIVKQSLKVLTESGMLIFEIGHEQKKDVISILAKYGFKDITCIKDLAGKDRVIKAVIS